MHLTISEAVEQWPHATEIKRRLVNNGYDAVCRFRYRCRGLYNNEITFYIRQDKFTELPLVDAGGNWRESWTVMSMQEAEELASTLDGSTAIETPPV